MPSFDVVCSFNVQEIDNAVNIGRNALVGMGSVVRKDVSENMIVVGNPAKELRKKK